jgi:hypothetical protein
MNLLTHPTLHRDAPDEDARRTRYINRVVEEHLEDRDLLGEEIERVIKLFEDRLQHREVTLCRCGNGEDIMGILRDMLPLPKTEVELAAYEYAVDNWNA